MPRPSANSDSLVPTARVLSWRRKSCLFLPLSLLHNGLIDPLAAGLPDFGLASPLHLLERLFIYITGDVY